MKIRYLTFCFTALSIFLIICGFYFPPVKDQPKTSHPQTIKYDYPKLADTLLNTLYSAFSSSNKRYFKNINGDNGLYYWPNAHALDVLIDAYQRTGDKAYLTKMKTLLNGIKAANGNTFLNWYYDDMAWLANACLRIYLLTKGGEYLSVANQLYADIKTGWNSSYGGGITWRKGEPGYKNIPSTGNLCILAARYYKLNAGSKDLTLAKDLFNWMQKYMVKTTGQVQNGINRQNDGKMDDWIFTYNQGLFIGSAVEMYNATKDASYLQAAIKTANNLLTDTALVTKGYLKSEGQGDHGLFKGVLVRYLTLLIETPALDERHHKEYALFIQRNAQSLCAKGIARPAMMVSADWTKSPAGVTDLTTQLSGMIMIEMAAKLKSEGKIQ